MSKFFYIFVVVFTTSCASNIVPKFPIASYANDKSAVELYFACGAEVGIIKNDCTAGLYIDYLQVHEAFGDYTLTKGGMKKETVYKIKIPEGKYLFSPHGKGRYNGSYDKFINVSGKTCIILKPIELELNIFARVTDDEGSWVKTECSKFDEITQGFEKIVLNEPVSFTDKIL